MAGIQICITSNGIEIGEPDPEKDYDSECGCVRKPQSELPRGNSIISLPIPALQCRQLSQSPV